MTTCTLTPSEHEKDLLLAVLKYHMPMELRHQVLREVPQAYNAWMGYEVVHVEHADGRIA